MIFLDATGRIMTYDEMMTQSQKENNNNGGPSDNDMEDDVVSTKITNKNERGSLVRTFLFGALLLLVYTIGYSTPLLIVAATGGQALEN
jgi:hypothetical protein